VPHPSNCDGTKSQSVLASISGHLLDEMLDELGFRCRCCWSGTQIESQCGLRGHADLRIADEVADFCFQIRRFTRRGEPNGQRQYHLVLISESIEAKEGKAMRNRPAHLGRSEIARPGPVQLRRQTCIAWRTPVDLPARLELHLQTDGDGALAPHRIRGGNKPQASLVAFGPSRSGGLRGTWMAKGSRQEQNREYQQPNGQIRSLN